MDSPNRRLWTGALLGKPVQLLGAQELKKGRDGLLAKIAPATINRICGRAVNWSGCCARARGSRPRP
jgi:hypothetical protein